MSAPLTSSAAFETVTWLPVTGRTGQLPDADLDVLCCLAHGGGVYVGAWTGEGWSDCSGADMPGEVTHWADMPQGPTP